MMSGKELAAVVGVVWQRVRSIEEILREGEAARGGNRGMSEEDIYALVCVLAFGMIIAWVFLSVAHRSKVRQWIRKGASMKSVGYAGLVLMLGCFVWGGSGWQGNITA